MMNLHGGLLFWATMGLLFWLRQHK